MKQPVLMNIQTFGDGTTTAGGSDFAAAAAVAGGGAAVSPVPPPTMGHTLGLSLSMSDCTTFHQAQCITAGTSSETTTSFMTKTNVQISWPKLKAVIAEACLKDDDFMMDTDPGSFERIQNHQSLPFLLSELTQEGAPPPDGNDSSTSTSKNGPPSATTIWQPFGPDPTLKSSSMDVTNYTIMVQYYDPDSDLIRITSTTELVEAMEQFADAKMMRMEAVVQLHPTKSPLKDDDLFGKDDDTDSEGDDTDQESERPWRKTKVVKSKSTKTKTGKVTGSKSRRGRSQKAKAAITAAKAAAALPPQPVVQRSPGKRKVSPPDMFMQRQAEEASFGATVGGMIPHARSSQHKKAKKESKSKKTNQKVKVNKADCDSDDSNDEDGIDEVMLGARTSRKGTNTLYYDENYPDGTDLRQETHGRIVYFCRNNDTLVGIAKLYGNVIPVEKLLYDNKVAHLQGLTKTGKLKPGTPIVLPLTYNDKNVEELDG